ncbi:MAG TPA: FeoA family protein [Anaerolineaceae bacterium]
MDDLNPQIPLTELKVGEHAHIVSIPSGRMIQQRLVSIGITPGIEVTMTQNYHHGPLVVTVRDTRIALGTGEAKRILVRKFSLS